MWGNRLGWTISAAIAIGAIAILSLIAHSSTRTEPTDFSRDPRNFQALNVPAPGVEMPAASPGAETSFQKAIAEYEKNRAVYEDFAAAGSLKSPHLKDLTAIDDLVDASGGSKLFINKPARVIGYEPNKPAIEAISVLGRVLIDRLALLNLRAGNREAAQKYALAGAALGAALCKERLCFDEFALGQELLGKSAYVLGQIDPEASGAAWAAYERHRTQFMSSQIEPMIRFVRSIDPVVVGTRTGDVFEMAKRSQERMWRVEAILALGRVRWFSGTSKSAADQRAALALVKKIAQDDPDPVIRAAAEAARDMTPEQYRMQ